MAGNPLGSFIWYELMTPDPDAIRGFYKAAVGWTISAGVEALPPEGIDYRHIVRMDGGSLGGVLHLTPGMLQMGAEPRWMPYLLVANVDAAVDAIVADGGRVLMPKTTIDVGSFAMLLDPFGAAIYVMTPITPPGMEGHASDVFSPMAVQRVGWNELCSDNLEGAKTFYARHFGFEFNNAMPMGPMGDYCFIDHHGQCLGAMMQRPDGDPHRGWRHYFRVPDIDAARVAVLSNGGTALNEPGQVPGGDWVFHALDPQQAFFGLVGARKG